MSTGKDAPLQSFLASQTLILQQMQKKNQEDAKANADCLRSIGEALTQLKGQIGQQGAQLSARFENQVPTAGTSAISGAILTQNIPWPQPLEVETGDVYDNFKLFNENWKTYCSATGIDMWNAEMEPRKINILLSILGDKAKRKYSNFHLKQEEMTTAENVMKLIKERLVSQRNLLFDRFLFHTCDQTEDESFEEYYLRLKRLIEVCKYDENVTANDMLRDKLAFGIKDVNLKKKFLRQDPQSLTLEKLIQTCKANELSELRFKDMSIEEKSVNKITKKYEQLKKCRFCDNKHEFKKELCPAWGKICKYCDGKNHFAKVCLKNPSNQKTSTGRKWNKKTKSIKKLQEQSDESDEECVSEDSQEELRIHQIEGHTSDRRKGRVDLTLKFNKTWKNVTCDLDTCSDANVIGYQTYCQLYGKLNPELKETKNQLRSFGGDKIEIMGEVEIPCKRNSKNFILVFLVVNVNHGPLLSERACLTLGLVKYCFKLGSCDDNEVKEKDREIAYDMLKVHQKVFKGYGNIPGTVSLEIKPDAKPVIQPARRVPVSLRQDLKQELKRLEKEGIIIKEEKSTDWVSNILLVKKCNSFRICLDPAELNQALKRPHFQFTTLEEILPEIGRARVFSTLDTKKGFWHMKLTEASSKLTTFWTPFGRYRWLRLPFGISSAPEIFANKMQEITHDLEGVEVLIDDILVYGCGDDMKEALEDHNRNLKKLLVRLEDNNCKLNREKINLCQTSVKFFGHVLTSKGLQPDSEKTHAITNMPPPQSREDLLRFLGMVTYLSRFIKNLSIETNKLRMLTREDVAWRWTVEEEEEFKKIKLLVTNIPNQRYFDVNKSVILECDASSTGLGAALYQDNEVVGYASRTLNKTEKNYAQIEKEMLAILFGCMRFDQLLAGNKNIVIKTDHKPLLAIFQKPLLKAPKRLQLMLMALQRYHLEVQFVKGKDNIVADALSRAPVDLISRDKKEFERFDVFKIKNEEGWFKQIEELRLDKELQISTALIDDIRTTTELDDSLQKLKNYISQGWPKHISDVEEICKVYFKYKDELSTQNGIIFRNGRIVIPLNLRKLLIEKVHVAHQGIEATLNLARETIFWPGMSTQISQSVHSCETCMKYMASQQHPPMQSHETPEFAFQFVSMDVFYAEFKGKKTKFLITVDHYSDFFELNMLRDMTAETLINTCKENFSRHGIPIRVCSDNGTNFENKLMKNLGQQWGFEFVTSAPKHQRGNGKAEATVKIAKRLVKKAKNSNEDLWYMILHWRNTPNKIGSSPNQRIFSRRTRNGIPMTNAHLQPQIIHGVPEKINENKKNSKKYYDKKTKNLPELETGQSVAVQLNPDTDKTWSKGEILKKIKDRDYLVEVNDRIFRRNVVNIKPFASTGNVKERSIDNQLNHSSPNNSRTYSPTSNENLIQLKEPVLSNTIATAKKEMNFRDAVETQTGIHDNPESCSRPTRKIKTPTRYKDYIIYQ